LLNLSPEAAGVEDPSGEPRVVDEDLSQADLTHLSLTEMTTEQRREMRRRYDDFVERVGRKPPVKLRLPAAGPQAKWTPPRLR
jgi:hypothetical protein